ncbi:MAG TPA: Txe/YoeB family addiction module toxin [Pyrinomonadaceae bacterium]|jgi:toxin YoeB|nr:Txe/YoeB family addiction module toxin [Pyrinomonadaceae bacterium]
MRIIFTHSAWGDYLWFQEQDRKLIKRINQLIKETTRSPFEGIGKPEPLKGDLAGYWSRRITHEHRMVYSATESELVIIALRFHYQD